MRKRLRDLRMEQGYSQASFSKAVNISTSHYAQIEQGVKGPSFKIAVKIKQTLGYKDDNLFEIFPKGA